MAAPEPTFILLPPAPPQTDPDTLHDLLDQVLKHAVVTITGNPDADPRPGQRRLSHDILTSMIDGTSHHTGCAGTGVGKSLAGLGPALLIAATDQHRSVLSTDTKALQAQYVAKDFPVAASAVEAVTGYRPSLAIHKGFSTFACPAKTVACVEAITGQSVPTFDAETAVRVALDDLDAWAMSGAADNDTVTVDGRALDAGRLAELTEWVLTGNGDRAEHEDASNEEWAAVSCDATDCVVDKIPQEDELCSDCPFYEVCPAQQSRDRAARADVIITNHSLLGMQAGRGIPTVLSSKRLGRFHHLLLDEAHELPGKVREAGGGEISHLSVLGAVAALTRVASGRKVALLEAAGRGLANNVKTLLEFALAEAAPALEVRVDVDSHPLTGVIEQLIAWAKQVQAKIPNANDAEHVGEQVRIRRAAARVAQLASDLNDCVDSGRSFARCVAWSAGFGGERVATCRFQPVDVSLAIRDNLCRVLLPESDEERENRLLFGGPTPMAYVSVSALSGTFPETFRSESGIAADPVDYESPFDAAYGSSVLFAPKLLSDDDLLLVCDRTSTGRWRLNVTKHRDWCKAQIVQAVRCNQGSAIVLAATAENGKVYAATLRATRPKWKVYTQWDGASAATIVERWRNDPSSVLVGTRSMMVGVDGQGDTCTLVVVDRPARAAGNLINDARAKAISWARKCSAFEAETVVYVGDAALLLEQAVGRLVRGVSDSGLCVVLDPRLAKGSPVSYPEKTRKLYVHALRRFVRKTTSWDQAMTWLAQHAKDRAARVTAKRMP